MITSRFAVLCFAAIQSSVITLTNTIFDIISSPDREDIMATLREDALQATSPATTTNSINNDDSQPSRPEWSKPALARMKHIDSAIRESMRLNGFIHRGVVKMVVAPGGITLPPPPPSPDSSSGGSGLYIPCGTRVGVSGYSIHRDEANYADAGVYQPFRFIPDTATTTKITTTTSSPPQGLVNTSPIFMGFSHGQHACPGRFFASAQLKIALACIALRYDVAPAGTFPSSSSSKVTEGEAPIVGGKRPENQWFFGHMAPPLTAKVLVRRRGHLG